MKVSETLENPVRHWLHISRLTTEFNLPLSSYPEITEAQFETLERIGLDPSTPYRKPDRRCYEDVFDDKDTPGMLKMRQRVAKRQEGQHQKVSTEEVRQHLKL